MKKVREFKSKYDYIYHIASQDNSVSSLICSADNAIRQSYSDVCNLLNKKIVLWEAGEGSLSDIRNLEKAAKNLRR